MFPTINNNFMEDSFCQNTPKTANPLINPLLGRYEKMKILSNNLPRCISTINNNLINNFCQNTKKSLFRFQSLNPIWTRVLKLPIWTGGGAKLPHILKIFKNAYISMKLTQNKVSNLKFWNQSNIYFHHRWLHHNVIIMWFQYF